MPKVYNKHHKDAPPDAVYVGRPSKWGNKHPIGWCDLCCYRHDREHAIEMYHEDLQQAQNYRDLIRDELKGKDLVCWCAPKPCHADILLEIANAGPEWIDESGKSY